MFRQPVDTGRCSISFEQIPPSPASRFVAIGIRPPGFQVILVGFVARSRKHRCRRVRQLVHVIKKPTVVADRLVTFLQAMLGDGIPQKLIPLLGRFQIRLRFFGIMLCKLWGTAQLGQSACDPCCRDHVFRKDNLGISIFRKNISFILAVQGINQKEKASICILHLEQIISLPFRKLQRIRYPVTTLRNSQRVPVCGRGREAINRRSQSMNEGRAVRHILAVITRIMVTAGHIDRPFFLDRIQTRAYIGHARSGMVFSFVASARHVADVFVCILEPLFSGRDFYWRRVTCVVGVPSERKAVVPSATLVVDA